MSFEILFRSLYDNDAKIWPNNMFQNMIQNFEKNSGKKFRSKLCQNNWPKKMFPDKFQNFYQKFVKIRHEIGSKHWLEFWPKI